MRNYVEFDGVRTEIHLPVESYYPEKRYIYSHFSKQHNCMVFDVYDERIFTMLKRHFEYGAALDFFHNERKKWACEILLNNHEESSDCLSFN